MNSNVKELAKKNRSFRGYDRSVKVSRQELLDLVDTTRFVASSINHQVLKYYIADDEQTVFEIMKNTGWAKGLPELSLPYKGKEPVAFIVICIDHSISKANVVYLRDVGACAQTILLQATEKNLGGCMLGSFNKEKIIEILNIPDYLEPNLLVAIGKPSETVVITDVSNGNTNYYRSPDGQTHYVPKRSLKELVMN